ncbi:MAG: D-hexose-6-phosphate mutarotase [Plesiomonas sp.]
MMDRFLSLPVIEQLSPSLSLRRHTELDILVIDHPKAQAAISLQGAQLLLWQPTDQQPVIWLSEKAAFVNGKALRGGIPICWPWFGRSAQPAHGFARNLPWQLQQHQESDAMLTLSLNLTDSAETDAYWPHPFSLTLNISIGEQLSLSLKSSSSEEIRLTEALHTYFAVGDISKTSVEALGSEYTDSLNKGQKVVDAPVLTLTEGDALDRIYTAAEEVSFIHDDASSRVIVVEHQGNNCVVAWNPGKEGARGMADMADHGYQTMLCVETVLTGTPAIVNANNSHELQVRIRIA